GDVTYGEVGFWEGPHLLLRRELRFGEDEAVQRPLEDVDRVAAEVVTALAQLAGGQCCEHLVLLRREVHVRDDRDGAIVRRGRVLRSQVVLLLGRSDVAETQPGTVDVAVVNGGAGVRTVRQAVEQPAALQLVSGVFARLRSQVLVRYHSQSGWRALKPGR